MHCLYFKAAFSPLITFQIKFAAHSKTGKNNLTFSANVGSFLGAATSLRIPWEPPSPAPRCGFLVCFQSVSPVVSRQIGAPQVQIKLLYLGELPNKINGQRSPTFCKLTATASSFVILPHKGSTVSLKLIFFFFALFGYLIFLSSGNLTSKDLPRGLLVSFSLMWWVILSLDHTLESSGEGCRLRTPVSHLQRVCLNGSGVQPGYQDSSKPTR